MNPRDRIDTRARLLHAAAELIAATPGEDISLRAVCDAVGVKMPTLYHYFGSKQGLIDAVVDRGFDMYLSVKEESGSSGDPIQDLRDGWDAHVSFGVANPGFYALMYGNVRPGTSPEAQSRPSAVLRGLTDQAEAQGRLVVPSAQAAAHVLATNIGVTLRMIVIGEEDPELSASVREGVLTAITGSGASVRPGPGERPSRGMSARGILEHAAAHPELLGEAETHLFVQWVQRLTADRAQHPANAATERASRGPGTS